MEVSGQTCAEPNTRVTTVVLVFCALWADGAQRYSACFLGDVVGFASMYISSRRTRRESYSRDVCFTLFFVVFSVWSDAGRIPGTL